MKNRLLISLLSLTLLSCTSGNNITSPNQDIKPVKVEAINPRTVLKGKVDFGNSFKITPYRVGALFLSTEIKAEINPTEEVTVSLLHIPNPGAMDVMTALTGVTKPDGSFELIPANNFNLNPGDIYILEAMKKVSTDLSEVITLRTYVRWTDNGWESITKPNLVINTYTTALTIITSFNPDTLSPYMTIGAIDISGSIPVISQIGNISSDTVSQVNETVNKVLSDNTDPVAAIKFNPTDNSYPIANYVNLGKLDPLHDCNGCDRNELINLKLSGQDKYGWEMINKNLSKADLSFNNMKASNFSGSNLSQTNLSNVSMIGANLENVNMNKAKLEMADLGGSNIQNSNLSEIQGSSLNIDYANCINVNLSNSELSYSNFSHSDLTNANFRNSDLTRVNFEGAIISGADFSGAKVDYATWPDGSVFFKDVICQEGSIGQCIE